MHYRGINYDVGIDYREGALSRKDFDPEVIRKEIEIIRSELHCNAVRIYGSDISRLVKASGFALENNLAVFFSPVRMNASQEETTDFILQAAREAELLRETHGNVVFIIACELSLFSKGFIDGATTDARLHRMFNPFSTLLSAVNVKKGYNKKLNLFIGDLMPVVRERFRGPVSYASGTWECVDWGPFDMVGIDHYRSSHNRSSYRDELKRYFRHGKPVMVLEFGCCCYRGAEDKGAAGWMIVDWDKERVELRGDFIRDEAVQAEYLKELLDMFSEEQVSGSFVFTFIQPSYVYDESPKYDLDMAGYGIVKQMRPGSTVSYQGLPWVPKEAFTMLCEYYSGYLSSDKAGDSK